MHPGCALRQVSQSPACMPILHSHADMMSDTAWKVNDCAKLLPNDGTLLPCRNAREKGWTVKADGDKGYRRVVASPAAAAGARGARHQGASSQPRASLRAV